MLHKSQLLWVVLALLQIKKVTLSEEGLVKPPVSVDAVARNSLFSSVDRHTLVDILLVLTKPVKPSQLDIFSLYDLYGIAVHLLDAADSALVKAVEEVSVSALRPTDFIGAAEMVLGHNVLIVLKSEHFPLNLQN